MSTGQKYEAEKEERAELVAELAERLKGVVSCSMADRPERALTAASAIVALVEGACGALARAPRPGEPDANGMYYCAVHHHEQAEPCHQCALQATEQDACEHCGTAFKMYVAPPTEVQFEENCGKTVGDDRAAWTRHTAERCRDILKAQRDEAVAWQAAKAEWIDVATRTLATIPKLTEERDRARAEGRGDALLKAADLCDREARACESHAKAFGETHPKSRMTLAKAHEMAAGQSKACGAYIRQLVGTPEQERVRHRVEVAIIGEPSDGALAIAKLVVNGYGVCQWPATEEVRNTHATGAEYAQECARVLREALTKV